MENIEFVEFEMPYYKYKKVYSKYKTIPSSYNKNTKTIIVLIPLNKATTIEKRAGERMKRYNAVFTDNETGAKWDTMLNYFTDNGLQKQIKEREKDCNSTCINK